MCQIARGITFEIPDERGKWLLNILKPIDFKKYNWLIGPGEGYIFHNNDSRSVFPDDVQNIRGEELLKFINTSEPQYIIHADLKAFSPETTVFDLDTYEEFLASYCELVLLIADSIYTTIYCKDYGILNKLYLNAESLKVDSLAYITDQNDSRIRLSV